MYHRLVSHYAAGGVKRRTPPPPGECDEPMSPTYVPKEPMSLSLKEPRNIICTYRFTLNMSLKGGFITLKA